IKHISFPSDCLCVDGFVDIEKAKSITCSGLDSYHTTQRLARLSYAKPDSALSLMSLTYEINPDYALDHVDNFFLQENQ
ncbi:MAG: hypothetical protein ACKOE5_01635, partial [Cytophagales bacterium]